MADYDDNYFLCEVKQGGLMVRFVLCGAHSIMAEEIVGRNGRDFFAAHPVCVFCDVERGVARAREREREIYRHSHGGRECPDGKDCERQD